MNEVILGNIILLSLVCLPLAFAVLVRVGDDLITSYKKQESKKVYIRVRG